LIHWVNTFSFTEDKIVDLCDLADGIILYKILCQIAPLCFNEKCLILKSTRGSRKINLATLMSHLKSYYENILFCTKPIIDIDICTLSTISSPMTDDQAQVSTVDASVSPHLASICRSEVVKIIQLIVGCIFSTSRKCDRRDEFLGNIQKMPLELQSEIVSIGENMISFYSLEEKSLNKSICLNLSGVKTPVKEYRKKMVSLQQQIDELEVVNDDLNKRIQESLDSRAKEFTLGNEQKTALQERNRQLESIVEELKKSVKEVEEQSDTYLSRNLELEEQLQEHSKLKQQKQELQNEHQKLQGEYDSLKQDMLKIKGSDIKKEAVLTKRLADAEAEVLRLKRQNLEQRMKFATDIKLALEEARKESQVVVTTFYDLGLKKFQEFIANN